MIATKETTRTAVRVDLIEREKLLAWLGLASALTVSAALNVWNLAQNGYSNLYYSVAVQSMMQSWHNFFFASYDAGGFISVDKPPVALWIQTISAKIFGFSPLSLLLPEALAGVASVALLYYLVKRVFGTLAGFVAAMALALTPIAVAVERTNNTDTFLMLTLLLAAWAITLAVEKGRFRMLALSLALVGLAFNIKMLAAFVILPAFYLLYLITAPVSWQKRLLHLTLGSVILFGVALSWPLAVDLTPADQRPWVGGSPTDSVLQLALGYNGLGRVTGNEQIGGRGGFGGGPRGGFPQGAPGGNFPNFGGVPLFGNGSNGGAFRGGPGGSGPGGGGMFGAGQPGALRLFTGEMAGQWSWLFPLAAVGLVASVVALRRRRLPLERPNTRRVPALLLWGGWLAMYGVVFSIASGIFHPYYLIMLGPAAAALVGIGVAALWTAYRRGGWQVWLLPVALLATALWQMNVLAGYPDWAAWLVPPVVVGSIAMATCLVLVRLLDGLSWRRWSPGFIGVALVGLLLAPTAWSITPVLAGPSNASLPTAGPEALNQNDPTSWTRLNGSANRDLISYLEANRDGYFYLLAVSNSQQASSIALETGEPVLATAGFMGSDPALTAEKLAEMVANKQVRFVMGLSGGGMRGGDSSSVSSWIQSNCTVVDPSLYESQSGLGNSVGGFSGPFSVGNSQLYDCAAR
jgi:4-amino-4-deoxy-L-arabinose transferase-like glycosyltransferase